MPYYLKPSALERPGPASPPPLWTARSPSARASGRSCP